MVHFSVISSAESSLLTSETLTSLTLEHLYTWAGASCYSFTGTGGDGLQACQVCPGRQQGRAHRRRYPSSSLCGGCFLVKWLPLSLPGKAIASSTRLLGLFVLAAQSNARLERVARLNRRRKQRRIYKTRAWKTRPTSHRSCPPSFPPCSYRVDPPPHYHGADISRVTFRNGAVGRSTTNLLVVQESGQPVRAAATQPVVDCLLLVFHGAGQPPGDQPRPGKLTIPGEPSSSDVECFSNQTQNILEESLLW